MNTFGRQFRIHIYGESHGSSVGVLIDGIKAGLVVNHDLICADLARRRPLQTGETSRIEEDNYIIESGVFEGKTTGSPLLIRIPNTNIKSEDYTFKDHPRPSHSDYVSMIKYGHTLPGSGHFSGRLTSALVVAGSFAKMIQNYPIQTEFVKVGRSTSLDNMEAYIKEVKDANDSLGAILKVTVKNVLKGLGEPFFYSVESAISSILYSIPGIKGVSFGIGFEGVSLLGSAFNDVIIDDKGTTKTNHSGGINGGITNGNDLIVNVFVRPAASIGLPQETFNFSDKHIKPFLIEGRHDAFIARRAIVVIENAIMIALTDLKLCLK